MSKISKAELNSMVGKGGKITSLSKRKQPSPDREASPPSAVRDLVLIGKNNSDAINAVSRMLAGYLESKARAISQHKGEKKKKWKFDIVRDSKDLMKSIIATEV